MKRLKLILFILLMLLLWIPMIQQWTAFAPEPKLNGAFVVPEKPEFSFDSLKNFQYQKQLEDYLNNTLGFRPAFVKIKNSWEYFVFGQINVDDQIQGKNGYIYSNSSIEKMLGLWYAGSIKNEQVISKINYLKEGIEKNGAHFLVLFAPSKESVLPEFLPERYAGKQADSSDYKDFIAGYKKYNIPYIDYAAYFDKIKAKAEHPLFTKTGFHWSSYAALIAQDTLLNYMQNFLKDPMPQYKNVGMELSDTARDSEADFEEPMNLLYSLNQPQYVYPRLEMIPSTLKNKRPKVIIIGDSFFWQLNNLKMLGHIFSEDSKYWYYFARYSSRLSDGSRVLLKDLNIIEELQSADYVILVGSFGTTTDFPFGVTDYYYEKTSVAQATFNSIRTYIKNNPDRMKKINERSAAEKKPVDEIIDNEAKAICSNRISFNLKAANGKFVCADAGRDDIVIADKAVASGWELFSSYQLDDDHIVITSFQDKFLCAELKAKGEITATRTEIGSWEVFTKIKLDNNVVAFKADNGKYLSVDPSSLQVMATADKIGEEEKFILIKEGSK